jgi:hypothetical protein
VAQAPSGALWSGGDGAVARSADGGATWEAGPSSGLPGDAVSVAPSAGGRVLVGLLRMDAAGDRVPLAARSADGGATWWPPRPVPSVAPSRLAVVASPDRAVFYAVVDDGDGTARVYRGDGDAPWRAVLQTGGPLALLCGGRASWSRRRGPGPSGPPVAQIMLLAPVGAAPFWITSPTAVSVPADTLRNRCRGSPPGGAHRFPQFGSRAQGPAVAHRLHPASSRCAPGQPPFGQRNSHIDEWSHSDE